MIGFKKKSKKESTSANLSENILVCKSAFEKLIELEGRKFEIKSNLIKMEDELELLLSEKDELKKNIVEAKQKFMSTETMEDFSITEEIVNMQKKYVEAKDKFNEKSTAVEDMRNEFQEIEDSEKTESQKISNVITSNPGDFKEMDIPLTKSPITEEMQENLNFEEISNEKERYIKCLETLKDHNIKEFELNLKKLTVLEPLNQIISQNEFIRGRVLELRNEINDLDDEEFLLNQATWQEINKLREKYIALKEKMIIKKEKYREITVMFNDNSVKKEYLVEMINGIEK